MPILVNSERFTSLTICSNWFSLNDKIHQEWRRLKPVSSPLMRQIKILLSSSINRIITISVTKITDKHHHFPSEWLVCRQFIGFFNQSGWHFIHLFQWFASVFKNIGKFCLCTRSTFHMHVLDKTPYLRFINRIFQ